MGITRHILLCLSLLLACTISVHGQEPISPSETERVDIKSIVFEHLEDGYDWHILTIGTHRIVLPLAVIVLGRDNRWHIFPSSRLPYHGFAIAEQGEYKGRITEAGLRPKLDLSLTKNALALLINCSILLLLLLPLARWYRHQRMDAPGGIRGTIELLIEYIIDEVIRPSLGAQTRKYAPLLLTMFFFILVNNLMGLIPFFPAGANVTGNIAVTMVLALCTFLTVNLSGTKDYWKDIFWPDVPLWLKLPAPLMPVIEFVGIFTKPFALMIRLFANIFAGHIVILGLACVIFATVRMGATINSSMTVVAIIFSIFMLCLELLVAFIQAYVFTLLSAVFIGMATAKHPHKTTN